MRRRLPIGAAVVAALSLLGSGTALAAGEPTPTPTRSAGVLYQLPAERPCLKGRGNCAIYPKAAQLPSGRLVASFELASVVPRSQGAAGETLPIYTSDDAGRSWQHTSEVKPPAELSKSKSVRKYTSNWTNPYLYVLPQRVGDLRKGTLLLASVVSGEDAYYREQKAADPAFVPSNDGDRKDLAIALFSSTTSGRTWKFQNVVTTGGWQGGGAGAPGKNVAKANTHRQIDPVWEPYLMVYRDRLVAYYSDENEYSRVDARTGRLTEDPRNDTAADPDRQILAHRTWNGRSASWSEPVADVTGLREPADDGRRLLGGGRPGMTNVVPTRDGRWMLTFEYFGGGDTVRYKFAKDPLRFFSADGDAGFGVTGLPVARGSKVLSQGGSPVTVRLPDGRLAFNAGASGDVWVNRGGRSTDPWTQQATPLGAGYSRNLTYERSTGDLVILRNVGESTLTFGRVHPVAR